MNWFGVEDSLSHNQKNYFYKDSGSSEYSFPHKFSFSQPQVEVERSTLSPDLARVKKLNHNASERDRRTKINRLISSLRSLLPATDQTRKMSIPDTIWRVLRYIPQLQQQVEGLIKKKEELLSRISQQEDAVKKETQRKIPQLSSVFVVSTTRLNDDEAAIQISSYEVYKTPLSEILLFLEDNGFSLLNASSSETYGGRVFYNLHLKTSVFPLDTEHWSANIIEHWSTRIMERWNDKAKI